MFANQIILKNVLKDKEKHF